MKASAGIAQYNESLFRLKNTGVSKRDLTLLFHCMLLILDSTDNAISTYTTGNVFHSIFNEYGPVERIFLDQGNYNDCAFLENAVSSYNPDIILNCIEYGDIDRAEYDREIAYSVNGFLMKDIASLCRDRNIRLVALGSSFVFSGRSGTPGREDDIHDPINVYGDSKSLGEMLIVESGCRSLTVRLPYLYGDGIPLFNHGIGHGSGAREVTLMEGQVIAPTRTVDAARAVAVLVERGAAGVYHFCAGGSVMAAEFASRVLDLAGRPCEGGEKFAIKQVSDDEILAPADRPMYNVLDTGKYVECTGLRPCMWEAALDDYIMRNRDSLHITDKEMAR